MSYTTTHTPEQTPEIILNHTMKGGGKTWSFQIGGAGCNKKVTRIPEKMYNVDINIDIYGFGQDSLGILKQSNQLILTLADGHGPTVEGKEMSYKVHEYMIKYIGDYRDYFVKLLRRGDHKYIEKIVYDISKQVDEALLTYDIRTSEFKEGGTTFTMIHKILDEENGALYTLSYNVGDSPYFKIKIGEETTINEVSQEQNCDNIKCVENYYNLCMKDGDTPSEVILGRFNTPNGFKTQWMGEETIKPYNIHYIDGKYKCSVNESIMIKFYEEAPTNIKEFVLYNGGPQSIRGRIHNLTELDAGRYPTTNFGSTLSGGLQTPFSFGDKKSKHIHHIKCVPHITITKEQELHEQSFDFVSSDGAIDCLTDKDIKKLFEGYGKVSQQAFMEKVEKTINANARNGGFGFSNLTNIPTWDDLSYWIVETKVSDDLEFKLTKLEEEHKQMLELATKIKRKLSMVNTLISALSD
jgi:serine/threonine protein phosphatase PrpC